MKHITILVPENAIIASLEGTRRLFNEINEYAVSLNLQPLFQIRLVGLSCHTSLSAGTFIVKNDGTLNDFIKTDLIIIPALEGDVNETLSKNKDFIPWLITQHEKGSEIASLCLGAFLLAQTGLLKGRKCAIHWMAENQFRCMFPDIILITEKIITDENRIYSSGGAFSYLNLILYLIEKYAGREMAIYGAKVFGIDINRTSKLPFTVFHAQKEHDDLQIKHAQEFIEENYQEKISVDQLAALVSVGRRNFERRFKKATANTVVQYMHRVKIEIAKRGLESGRKNVNDLMYEIGYSDKKAFRNVFKKNTGVSPVKYKKMFVNFDSLN
ncbi:MAG: helix-turn-helix domain-containing protein [Ferruginibacter sp.]